MSNLEQRIVVFESRPRWEPELQRQFQGEPIRVSGCRTWSELSSMVFPNSPLATKTARLANLVVIDLPNEAADGLQWLSRISSPMRTSAVVVLCSVEAADLEWSLRDAGVEQVFVGELTSDRLARSCRGLLANQPC